MAVRSRSTAVVGLFGSLCRGGFAGLAPQSRIDLDVRGELPFVVDQLLGADQSIAVAIEVGKEAIGIGAHFVRSQSAIMVAIGLIEPARERIVGRPARSERLAH